VGTLEREIKLMAPEDFDVPDFDGIVAGVVAMPPIEQSLETTYYDTADLRLARSGISLRHRTGEGTPRWTLKLPVESRGSLVTRNEIEFDGDSSAIPPEARSLVRAYVRRGDLGKVACLATTRSLVELQGADGCARALVCDDRVSVDDGTGVIVQFREVEVEARDDGDDVLAAAAKRLRHAGAHRGKPMSKLARALGSRAPVPLTAVGVEHGASVGEVFRAALVRSTTRLLAHDPGVRLGDDAEDVHQARVATRRLRSDLRTFRDVVDDAWATGLRTELGWLADLLGAVRDSDVLLERLLAQSASMPEADQRAAATLLAALADERAVARAALLAGLESDRYLDLLDALIAGAADAPLTARAQKPAKKAMAKFVRRAVKHVDNAAAALGDEPADEDLHNLRIRAKRARYAVDAARPVWGDASRALAKAMAGVQGVLGDLQDAVVAEQWLRAREGASVAEAFVAGELSAVQRAAAADSRAAFPSAWADASAPKLRAWLR
jgi:CHAD domain-containing protein